MLVVSPLQTVLNWKFFYFYRIQETSFLVFPAVGYMHYTGWPQKARHFRISVKSYMKTRRWG